MGKGCVMADALEYAKYFIRQGLDTKRNTFDGNMKLQKLLTFANLISLAEFGKRLFDNSILAFEHGCVVEEVRLKYKNDCYGFVAESKADVVDFTKEELDVLALTVGLFGHLSARELSEINHELSSWQISYRNSIDSAGYKDKSKALVSEASMLQDVEKMKHAVKAFRDSEGDMQSAEIVNDVVFYYVPGELILTDEILEQLYSFSLAAVDKAYSVYLENEKLVIY